MGHIGAWFKEHPYLGGSFILGGFILIMLLRSSGSSSSSTSSDLSTMASLQAEQDSTDSANYQASLAAQVSNNQTLASLNETNTATRYAAETALASRLLDSNDVDVAASTELNESNSAFKYLDTQEGDAYTLASKQLDNSNEVSNRILDMVQDAGLNHGTASLSSALTQDLALAANPSAAATVSTSTASQTASNASADASETASTNKTYTAISNVAGKILGGLF